jgi:hypothetical protein
MMTRLTLERWQAVVWEGDGRAISRPLGEDDAPRDSRKMENNEPVLLVDLPNQV